MSEQNPKFFIARVALVAQSTQIQLRSDSAVPGAWTSLAVQVDPGDTFRVGTNAALVAQATQNQGTRFSSASTRSLTDCVPRSAA